MEYKLNKQSVRDYKNTRKIKRTNPLCKAPFSNLYFSRNGDVLSCCFNREYVLGRYPENSPSEIWNGKKLKNFRKSISKNSLVTGCDICLRELGNGNYNGVIARQFDFLNPKRKFPIMMEFELDNICNLECIMCNGELSSSIEINREKKEKRQSYYDKSFINYIKAWLKKSKLLRFGGGEPFLIPIYYDIWDIVLAENPECKIYVQTNGTIINDRIRKLLSSGQFELGVSLDSLNTQRFESIRINAKLKEVLSNIDEFIELIPPKKDLPSLVISTTLLNSNWIDMPSLVEYANQKNAQIVFNTVWTPLSRAVFNLKSNELNKITEFLKEYRPSSVTKIEKHNATMYLALISQIYTWYQNAVKSELISSKTDLFSDDELEKYLRKIILEQVEYKELFTTKLDEIFLYVRNNSRYREYLTFISKQPIKDIVRSIELHTIEQLKLLIDKGV